MNALLPHRPSGTEHSLAQLRVLFAQFERIPAIAHTREFQQVLNTPPALTNYALHVTPQCCGLYTKSHVSFVHDQKWQSFDALKWHLQATHADDKCRVTLRQACQDTIHAWEQRCQRLHQARCRGF